MIKILFLAANPSDTTRLRVDQESRAIDQAMRHAEFRDKFDLQQQWAVQVADLQALLLRHQPDIGGFCITPQKGKIQPVTDAFPLRMDRVH
jgi:hypothetical protein